MRAAAVSYHGGSTRCQFTNTNVHSAVILRRCCKNFRINRWPSANTARANSTNLYPTAHFTLKAVAGTWPTMPTSPKALPNRPKPIKRANLLKPKRPMRLPEAKKHPQNRAVKRHLPSHNPEDISHLVQNFSSIQLKPKTIYPVLPSPLACSRCMPRLMPRRLRAADVGPEKPGAFVCQIF